MDVVESGDAHRLEHPVLAQRAGAGEAIVHLVVASEVAYPATQSERRPNSRTQVANELVNVEVRAQTHLAAREGGELAAA
jgi:hypothetical protein